jgi:hypothetical protein
MPIRIGFKLNGVPVDEAKRSAGGFLGSESRSSRVEGVVAMHDAPQARRQQLLRELARVERQLTATQKSLARLESRITVLSKAREKAA